MLARPAARSISEASPLPASDQLGISDLKRTGIHTSISPFHKAIPLLSALTIFLGSAAEAAESGRDNTGPGAETHFTTPAGLKPGFYSNTYYYHYSADHFGEIPKFRTTSNTFIERVVYLSPLQLLDAHVGIYAYAPLIEQTLHAAGQSHHRTSFGDFTFSPFLYWAPSSRLGVSAALEITSPTGQYDPSRPVNGGLNYYTFKPQLAFTWYPTQRSEFSMRSTYAFNTTNNDTHYRSGQTFHFDYSASYAVFRGLHAGLNGYYIKQVTDDRVRGHVYEDGFRGRVFAVGPAVHYIVSHRITLEARWMKEFKVQNRPRGDAFWMKLAIADL